MILLFFFSNNNDLVIDYMRMRIKDKDCTILGGEFLHIRCAAQILNLIVTNDLKHVHDLIIKVRNDVRYVRY